MPHERPSGFAVRPLALIKGFPRKCDALSGETERAGFEPATHLSARTRFPVALLRPLGHLSLGRRAGRIVPEKPALRGARLRVLLEPSSHSLRADDVALSVIGLEGLATCCFCPG